MKGFRRSAAAALALMLIVAPGGVGFGLSATLAAAHPAPDSFADLAEKLLPAVVNISTTQTVKPEQHSEREHTTPELPQFPPGSPFEEFFKDFFNRNHPHSGEPQAETHKATSLGS